MTSDQINERLEEIDNLLYPDRPYPVDDEANLGVLMEERQALRASIKARLEQIERELDDIGSRGPIDGDPSVILAWAHRLRIEQYRLRVQLQPK